jgi:hypothetical protein
VAWTMLTPVQFVNCWPRCRSGRSQTPPRHRKASRGVRSTRRSNYNCTSRITCRNLPGPSNAMVVARSKKRTAAFFRMARCNAAVSELVIRLGRPGVSLPLTFQTSWVHGSFDAKCHESTLQRQFCSVGPASITSSARGSLCQFISAVQTSAEECPGRLPANWPRLASPASAARRTLRRVSSPWSKGLLGAVDVVPHRPSECTRPGTEGSLSRIAN